MTAPPPFFGLTRWEFVEGGVRFPLWARPIVADGGARVVPVTLVWHGDDGTGGLTRCSGLIEAMEHAARITAQRETPRQP